MPAGSSTWQDDPDLIRAFQSAVSALVTNLDRETILDQILAALHRLLPADAAEVWLVKDATATLCRSHGCACQVDDAGEPLRRNVNDVHYLRAAAEDGHPIHRRHAIAAPAVDNVASAKAPTEAGNLTDAFDYDFEVGAYVTTPLIHGDDLVGFANVASADAHAFDEATLRILSALAPVAAAALHNAALYAAERQAREEAQAQVDTLRQERDQLIALTQIDRQILAMSDSPEEVMRAILDHALGLMHLKKGIIVLVRDNGEPEFIHGQGLKDMAETQHLMMTYWQQEHTMHQGRGPEGYVALDRIRDKPERFAAWAHKEEIRALLTVPLWIRDRLVGRLTLLDSQFRGWTKKDRQMAQMLAGQAAIAVDKAMLTQRLRRRLHEAEILNRALQAANPSLDPEDVLTSICREVQRALNVPWVAAGVVENGHQLRRAAEAHDAAYAPLAWDSVDLEEIPSLASALTNRTMLIFESVQDEAPDLAQRMLKDGTQSAIFVPLTLHDTNPEDVRTAILYTEVSRDYRTKTFSEDDVRLVRLIAAAVTPTLENAHLFRQVEKARAQAEEAYAQLQHQDEVKSQFIQNVSHELRTPLAIVKGYTDLMVEGRFHQQQDPILTQAIEALHTQTDNLVRLVEAITTLDDRVEISRLDTLPQPIQPVCQASIKTHWQKALRRRMEIFPEMPASLPPVDIDRPQMLRALNHILDNALKFSREGGKIWMRAFARENYVWIEVEDEGIGLPEAELERIFDRFYQVNGTSTRRHGGMGLGLSVVREVVTRHKGRVWASSAGENQGTTITIKLPIYEAEEAS
jgi:signal transduction histidine kinase